MPVSGAAFDQSFELQATAGSGAAVAQNYADDNFLGSAFATTTPKCLLSIVATGQSKDCPITDPLTSEINNMHGRSHTISELQIQKVSERPVTMVLACKRHPVARLIGLIPTKFLEALERNQQIASCCRHPETHDVEAFRSRPEEHAPDVYVFHCPCGRRHMRFCIGGGDERPSWEVA